MQQRMRTRGSSCRSPRRSAGEAAGTAAISSLRAACACRFSASRSTRRSYRLLSTRPFGTAAVLFALPKEARQLGGDRVARGDVELRAELVDALLELLDVGGRVGVGGDGLAD